MIASSLAKDGGVGIGYLARLRLAMVDEPESGGVGVGCFLDFVGICFGAVTTEVGEGGGCCLDLEERGRRMESERRRLKPVRLTGGSSDGMGGTGMGGYAE